MGDFDGGGRRWVRITATLLAVAVVGLSAGAAGVWIGRSGAPSAEASPPTAGASGVPMAPSWPATTPAPARAVGAADAGRGWTIPNPGAAGPFSVTDQGVPYGYRQDLDGAALAAVNAVVAGKYLAATFVDPVVGVGVSRRSGVRRPRREPRTGGVLHRAGRPRGRRGRHHRPPNRPR